MITTKTGDSQLTTGEETNIMPEVIQQVWIGFHGQDFQGERPVVLVRRKREGLPQLHMPILIMEGKDSPSLPTAYAQVKAAALREGMEAHEVRVFWGENYPGLQVQR